MKYLLFIIFLFSIHWAISEEINLKINYKGNIELKDKMSFKYGKLDGKIDNNSSIKINLIENELLYVFNPQIGNYSFSFDDIKNKKEIILYDKEYSVGPITVIGIKEATPNSNTSELNSNDRLQYDGGMFLDKLVGFGSIKKSPAYGNDPVMRGFKVEQLNILLNGCESSIAACPNRMDPPSSHIPMHEIEGVEIIKGPYGLRYGSSFGGAVNFVTIDEFGLQYNNVVNATIRTNYESNGNITKNNANLIYGNDKSFIGLYASYYEGGDYKDGSDTLVSSKFQKSGFGINGGFKFGGNTFKAKASYDKGKDADFPTLNMDLRNDETYMFDLGHEYNFDNETIETIQTKIYFTKVDHLMNNYLRASSSKTRAESPVVTINYGGRSEAKFNLAGGLLYSGLDYKYENADGNRRREMVSTGKVFFDNIFQNSTIQKISAFSQYNYQKENYSLFGAFRVEYNQPSVANPDSNFNKINPINLENQLNFSISFGSNYYIDNNMTIGLWAGRAQRSGSISERFMNYFSVGIDAYEIVGNPNIDQEVNNQIDLQYSLNTNLIDFKVNLFANLLNNYISAIRDTTLKARMSTSPGVRRISNFGDAYKYGVEMSFGALIGLGIQSNINLAYTYAELSNGEAMPEIMPLELDIRLIRKFIDDKLKTEFELLYAGAQNRVSPTFSEKATPDYYIINANVSYNLFKNLILEIGVSNLLNESYYEHLNRTIRGTNRRLHSPGTSFWGTIIVNI